MKKFKSYFKTTPLTEEVKIKVERGSVKQEEGIEQIYKGTKRLLSPSDILELFPSEVPITSIRRAITQLTKKGILVMTDKTKISKWNRPEHLWIHSDYKHLKEEHGR